jgi:hypothetical protein
LSRSWLQFMRILIYGMSFQTSGRNRSAAWWQ